jgi:nucleotide-binding universal stress UspA family protein
LGISFKPEPHIRSHRFTQRREQAEMKKILVAYDGDEPSRLALERGADLALAFGAQLAVISVTPWRNDGFPVDLWDDAGAHRRALKSAAEWLSHRGLAAELLAPAGDPAQTIEDAAKAGALDTIVVGSRGLGAVSRYMQGSVSEHVATNAKASVVIAR